MRTADNMAFRFTTVFRCQVSVFRRQMADDRRQIEKMKIEAPYLSSVR